MTPVQLDPNQLQQILDATQTIMPAMECLFSWCTAVTIALFGLVFLTTITAVNSWRH